MTESISAACSIDAAVRKRLLRRGEAKPLVVGLCGSQGCGKSTVCAELAGKWREEGLRVAVLSIDDFYLTRAQRQQLARRVHPLLATRGVPGTHDVSLGIKTLQMLGEQARVHLPRFDKSNDDHFSPALWEVVQAPVDLVLFEGWCVGARPESPDSLAVPINVLEAREDTDGSWRAYVNDQLASEYQKLFAPIDLLVLLAAPGFDVVLKWRTQQERQLSQQSAGPALMDEAALARFVQHYERLTRHILREMPERADYVLYLDENRSVVRQRSRQEGR